MKERTGKLGVLLLCVQNILFSVVVSPPSVRTSHLHLHFQQPPHSTPGPGGGSKRWCSWL